MLNELHREAQSRGVPIDGVLIEAHGGFVEDWRSSGITYRVEVDSPADPAGIEELIMLVNQLAEIPRAIRSGAPVTRTR